MGFREPVAQPITMKNYTVYLIFSVLFVVLVSVFSVSSAFADEVLLNVEKGAQLTISKVENTPHTETFRIHVYPPRRSN